MREILFRGKRVDNGEWIEGGICQIEGYTIILTSEDFEGILYKPPSSEFYDIEVIPETIGQYTGKELCGDKLFEGDIVESVEDYDDAFGYPATSHFYSVVVWDEENFCWAFKTDGYIQAFIDWTWDNTMKVGNIYDNPELMKGDKDNG